MQLHNGAKAKGRSEQMKRVTMMVIQSENDGEKRNERRAAGPIERQRDERVGDCANGAAQSLWAIERASGHERPSLIGPKRQETSVRDKNEDPAGLVRVVWCLASSERWRQ